MPLTFRPCSIDDVETVLADMRSADRAELEAMVGKAGVAKAVRDSLDKSVLSWAAEDEEGVVFVFGVAMDSVLASYGAPWMIGTTRTSRYPRELITLARPYVEEMLDIVPMLANAVDARNTASVRWLRAIGFTILDPIPLGVSKRPFLPFFMDA